MRTRHFALFVLLGMLGSSAVFAQHVQGTDPIQLSSAVTYQAMPTPAPDKSKDLDKISELPAWLQAKVTRYEAMAFSAGEGRGTIQTDKDIITTTERSVGKKTCIQELASNTVPTTFNRFGPTKGDQIVVLRGDVVNICK